MLEYLVREREMLGSFERGRGTGREREIVGSFDRKRRDTKRDVCYSTLRERGQTERDHRLD